MAAELIALYESLDYYYAAHPTRGASMHPPVVFSNITHNTSPYLNGVITHGEPPPLPYVPAGVWFDVSVSIRRSPVSTHIGSAYLRWKNPVRVLTERLKTFSRFHSALNTHYGPQPSWTNSMAIVRYVWWPIGFSDGVSSPTMSANGSPQRALAPNARVISFPLDAHAGGRYGGSGDRLRGLHALRDGDYVEIERWGGPIIVKDGPSIWANIWRGTGLFMRVTSPFASLHKSSAIIELLLELDARNPAMIQELGERLGLGNQLRAMHDRFADATPGETLSSILLTSGLPDQSRGPCATAGGWQKVLSVTYNQTVWLQAALAGHLHPRLVVDHFLLRRPIPEPGAYALHWLYGICGFGPYWRVTKNRRWATWDGIIAKLACVLGVKTVLFGAAPNDNGLLHQEVLDLDAPAPTSWPTILERGQGARTNTLHACFVRHDPRPEQLADHWERVGKFQLRDPRRAEDGDLIGSSTSAHLPCNLFGGNAVWTNAARPCSNDKPPSTVPHLSEQEGCHLWCASAMSEVHARVPVWVALTPGGGAHLPLRR